MLSQFTLQKASSLIALTLVITAAVTAQLPQYSYTSNNQQIKAAYPLECWIKSRDYDLVTPPLPELPELTSSTAVTINGQVKSINTGGGLYAILLAYQSDTNIIVARTYTDFSSGQYTLSIPAGSYSFYVRSFGYKPIEMTGVSIQGNQTLDFRIDNSVFLPKPPSFLTDTKFKDLAIVSGGSDSTVIALTSTSDLGPTVEVYNEFGNLAVNGQPLAKMKLYDDGTQGDTVPGDHVYTRSGIGYVGSTALRGGLLGSGLALYANIMRPTPGIVSIPDSSLNAVNPAFAVNVSAIDADAQYSRYAANVRIDPNQSGWEKEATKLFYQKFYDIYDFVFLFPNPYPYAGFAGLTSITKNDVLGIGLSTFDLSQTYGSSGKLQIVAVFNPDSDPPLLHETTHRWAAFLSELFDPSYSGHWGYSGVNGVLGGFDPSTLTDNGDGTYSVNNVAPLGWKSDGRKYSPLEMYLAGFTDNLSQLPRIPVLINPKPVGGNPNHITADALKYVTGQDIVAKYGVRNPAASQSQHAFRVAFVGVSDKLLNSASMAYLSVLSETYGGFTSNPTLSLTPLSFTEATSGLGRVDPTIVPANPTLALTSLIPSSASVGGPSFTLTVNGSNFNTGSVVRWNGNDRATTFVNIAQLKAQIPASDIATLSMANITVFNPAPGGGASNALNFSVASAPDLAITKSHSGNFTVGVNGVYMLTIKNVGSAATTGAITVTDLLPAGLRFVSATGVGWSWTIPGYFPDSVQRVTFTNAGPLAANATRNLTVTVSVTSPATSGVINMASVATAGDPNSANNVASDPTAVTCAFTVAPTSRAFGAAGGSGSVAVAAESGCLWTANVNASNASWIATTSGVNGNGNGTVNFSVAANTGPARTGALIIAGQTVTITQASGCAFTLSSISQSFTAIGGPGSVAVITQNGCAWTATSNSGFITITSGSSGAGNGTVNFTVAPNTSQNARTGTLTIGGQNFIVTQSSETPVPTLTSLMPNSAVAGGEAFTLTVTGAGFASNASVRWNGANRTTTFVSAAQVTAHVPASDLLVSGPVAVTVFNPTPGGGVSNTLSFTVTQPGYEADVAPRPNGNGSVTVADWTQVGLFAAGLNVAANGSEFQRADCAPRATLGNGSLTVSDWVQVGRYAAGLDPVTLAGGPAMPAEAQLAYAGKPPATNVKKGIAIGKQRTMRLLPGGKTEAITIEIEALGDENALGWSLRFNPSRWRFVGASVGVDISSANLYVNAQQAESGHIGLALALPAGQALPAGARQIVVVSFAPVGARIRDGVMTNFTDYPIAREVASIEANVLPASFVVPAQISLRRRERKRKVPETKRSVRRIR